MKLNEITKSKKDKIIQWFIDNRVTIDGSTVTSGFLNSEYAKGFRKCIEDMDEKTGVINFASFQFVFKNKLKGPPPFKIGDVYWVMRFFRLSDIQLFDFSSTICAGGLEFDVKDPKIDMNEVAKALEKITVPNIITITMDNTKQLKSTTKLTDGVQRFMNMKSCEDILIKFVGDWSKNTINIRLYPTNSLIKLTGWKSVTNGYEQRIESSFGNVMDFQEWLIDNGFEYLA